MNQHVIVLIDISFSMKKNACDIIKGLNLFVERLQKGTHVNEIYLSVVLFSHKIYYLCKAVPIKEVNHFSITQLPKFGFTYMYDAIGYIIKEWINEKMIEHNFFIITDGDDTGSISVSAAESRELCDIAVKNGWRITHCGVDAGNLGAGVSEIPSDLDDLESLLSGLCI